MSEPLLPFSMVTAPLGFTILMELILKAASSVVDRLAVELLSKMMSLPDTGAVSQFAPVFQLQSAEPVHVESAALMTEAEIVNNEAVMRKRRVVDIR
ncbi:MAG: hypothetical protein LBV12_01255 [Puniceicoccales bacterium]|nr:hypothetical protein [Puniceicoccales bacterium]